MSLYSKNYENYELSGYNKKSFEKKYYKEEEIKKHVINNDISFFNTNDINNVEDTVRKMSVNGEIYGFYSLAVSGFQRPEDGLLDGIRRIAKDNTIKSVREHLPCEKTIVFGISTSVCASWRHYEITKLKEELKGTNVKVMIITPPDSFYDIRITLYPGSTKTKEEFEKQYNILNV
jgi:hypothetical protein